MSLWYFCVTLWSFQQEIRPEIQLDYSVLKLLITHLFFLSLISPDSVVCHDLAVGQIQLQRPMSWFQAREFCQRHYVDLIVLSTEEQYFTLLNATTASKDSFWLGLQRQSTISGWKWVNGEELSYSQWLTENVCTCHCASLEAMLKKDNKLLARYCEELHMFVCQGE